MCTCCITWWPRHPVFCWIEHSRHSRAVVGYVTSCAHACLSVSCGVSWGSTGALSKLRIPPCPHCCSLGAVTHAPRLTPPCPLHSSSSSSASCLPTCQGRRPFWWHFDPCVQFSFCLSACADHTQVQLLCRSGPMCQWFVQVSSATLHHPPSSCFLSLHNVWLLYIFLADFTSADEN